MNGILMLVNNLYYFKTFLSNLDNRIINYKLFIINETRIDDKIDEIHHLLKYSQVNNYEVIDSKTIINELKKVVNTEFVDSYTMSMNILGVWYLFKNKNINKLLILDDDIILKNNYDDVFKQDCNAFLTNLLWTAPKYNQMSKNSIEFYQEFFRIFEFEYKEDLWNIYKNNYINSGQWLVIRDEFDCELYEYYLIRFFKSEVIKKFWDKRKNHVSWFIDERFLNLYFLSQKQLNNNLKELSQMFIVKVNNISKKDLEKAKEKSILHICNGKTKLETYNLLIDNGIIKGEKYDNKNN